MSNVKIIGPNVPNMPWQERPADNQTGLPLWRYNENPIIGRNPAPGVARIFNSAVMPYEDGFIGVFRGEQTNGVPYIYLGKSDDAIHWNFEENKIPFKDEDGNDFMPIYAYDPRLVKVEDTYIISSGVRISTELQLVWRRHRISRHLQELRIHSFHLTEMRFFSQERLMVNSNFCPVQVTADIHRLVISLFQRVRILNTGENTAM